MTRRYAARRDKNEGEIIATLRAMGCSVEQLDKKGVPDLLVGFADAEGTPTTILLEVKEGKGKLTPEQVEWHEKWQGQVEIVRTPETAQKLIERVTLASGSGNANLAGSSQRGQYSIAVSGIFKVRVYHDLQSMRRR